jgi:hypothetical protein
MIGRDVEVGDEVRIGLVVELAVGGGVAVTAAGAASEVRSAVGRTAGCIWLLQATEIKPEIRVLMSR